jgi:hypothetical protein
MLVRNVLKVCVSNCPKSPKGRSPSHHLKALQTSNPYSTEIKDYVFHIKAGNIDGVEPSVVDNCPVLSQIDREMHGDVRSPEIFNGDMECNGPVKSEVEDKMFLLITNNDEPREAGQLNSN